jgi:hypothetical protein
VEYDFVEVLPSIYPASMAVLQTFRPRDGGASLRRRVVEVDGREVAGLKPLQFVDLQVDPGSRSSSDTG